MTWWPGALVVAFGLVVLGWRSHRWWCMRRNGCPEWLEERAKDWDAKAELNGWKKRKVVPDEAWRKWAPAPPLDGENGKGVPSKIENTPTTGVANTKRKTTP